MKSLKHSQRSATIIAALLISLFGPVADAAGTALYVSTEGNDSWLGDSIDKPFATLGRVREQIRHLKREGGLPEGGITVWIRGGTYTFEGPFKLTEEDSGSKSAPIIYRAQIDEDVFFSGGQRLRKEWFVPVSDPEMFGRIIDEKAREKVLQANLREHGITDYGELSRHGYAYTEGKLPQMELYINGEHMKLARWPNDSTVNMAEVIDVGPMRANEGDFTGLRTGADPPDFWTRGGSFRYGFDRPEYWSQANDIWLAGSFNESWEWTYKKVARIDANSKTITFRSGEYSGLKASDNSFFYAENLLEEIDLPGEYYIDRNTGVLYILPPESFGQGDPVIMVSMLKTPMLVLDEVSNVTFRDIIFTLGRNIAIDCNDTESVRIEHCEVRNFSFGGIMLSGRNNAVSGSHLHHIGGTIVRVRGGDLMKLTPGNNAVENCHIHDFSHWNKVYNPAISVRGVGNRVSHCLIHNGPHQGISTSGNDHLFEYNEFFSVPDEIWDMAAIYSVSGRSPHQRGTVVRRNFFHHIGLSGRNKMAGVYPDDMTMGWVIEENIFYKIGVPQSRACWAVFNHGGSYIKTRNNIFVDCTSPFTMAYPFNSYFKSSFPRYQKSWEDVFARYDFANMPHGKKYPELLLLLKEDRKSPDSNTFKRNLIYNPTTPREFEGGFEVNYGPEELLQASDNWVAEEEPGFVNVDEMDLALREDSAVFRRIPGFKEIPFHEIGLSGAIGPFQRKRIDSRAVFESRH